MTKKHIFIIENNLQKVGQSFFFLVPSDNHDDTRSTCPTSVLTGIGQTLMSMRVFIAQIPKFYIFRTKHKYLSSNFDMFVIIFFFEFII